MLRSKSDIENDPQAMEEIKKLSNNHSAAEIARYLDTMDQAVRVIAKENNIKLAKGSAGGLRKNDIEKKKPASAASRFLSMPLMSAK